MNATLAIRSIPTAVASLLLMATVVSAAVTTTTVGPTTTTSLPVSTTLEPTTTTVLAPVTTSTTLPECIEDVDCADDLFCNGDEVCEGGVCYGGPPPCFPICDDWLKGAVLEGPALPCAESKVGYPVVLCDEELDQCIDPHEVCDDVIDFEGFAEGEVIEAVFGTDGIGPIGVKGTNLTAFPESTNAAAIYDTSCPDGCSGGLDNLGTPNETFAGPGVGEGGESGMPDENSAAQNNMLIVTRTLSGLVGDGVITNPRPQGNGKTVMIDFDFGDVGPVSILSLRVIDVDDDEEPPTIELFDDSDSSILLVPVPAPTGENGIVTFELPENEGVLRVRISLFGSGAIDDIAFELNECRPAPECMYDEDCDDGLFCNGEESCLEGECEENEPACDGPCNEDTDACVPCVVNDDCDGDSDGPFCDGGQAKCVSCLTSEHCADDLFCNGDEVCNAGDCVGGSAPCADDESCNEDGDTCDDCEIDADCADELFCNGNETCNAGSCEAGDDPCQGVGEDDGVCVEEFEICAQCMEDADCDDGLFCNGAERCISNGLLVAGAANNNLAPYSCAPGILPCAKGQACDEFDDECSEIECMDVITFKYFAEGAIISSVFAADGNGPIGVKGTNLVQFDEATNAAVAFDSSCPGGCTAGQDNLGTPNQDFAGPGIGAGGESGEAGENSAELGEMLIVTRTLKDANPDDGLVDAPRAQGNDKTVTVDFFFDGVAPVTIKSIDFIDIDEDEDPPGVMLFDVGDGEILSHTLAAGLGENSVSRMYVPANAGVYRLRVTLNGSGAIDNIAFGLEQCKGSTTTTTSTSTSTTTSTSTSSTSTTSLPVATSTTTTFPATTTTVPATTTTVPVTTTTVPVTTTTVPVTTTTVPVTTTTVPVTTTTIPITCDVVLCALGRVCVNTAGGPICQCPPGFVGDNCELQI